MKNPNEPSATPESVADGNAVVKGSFGEPCVMPDIDQLEIKNGFPVLPKIPGRLITMEMVKELCEA